MSDSQFDNIIKQFDTISLEEMDSVKLMNRVDTKFVFSRAQLLQILPELKDHYRIVQIKGNLTPSYESVYFDDDTYGLYAAHQRKQPDRFKVRYRKYVESNIAFLEVKHKKKGRTDKSRILVDSIDDEMPADHAEFVYGTGVPKNKLQPILVNRFNRLTLVAKEHIERLTLDINLYFKDDDNDVNLDYIVIAELKQEKVSRTSPFFSIMKEHQIRPYRISKYCIGVIKLLGKENIKYNRFKKKLLKLNKLKTHAS